MYKLVFASLVSALLIAPLTSCAGGIWDGAQCCACLLTKSSTADQVFEGDQSRVMDDNCYAGDRTYQEENSMCANAPAAQIAGTGDTTVVVTSMDCVDTVCENECGPSREAGLTFEVGDDN